MEPAVVISHGSWNTPEHYEELIVHLKKIFKYVVCPRLPSATSTLPLPETANLKHDTAAIRQAVTELADKGRPVVLLMHSYGGVVGNNAVDGLLWPQQKAEQKSGGVVHLVYNSAFVIPAGTAICTPFNSEILPWLYDGADGTLWMKSPRNAFYSHIEDEMEAKKWLDKTVLCPSSVIKDVTEYAPYELVGHGVDATYIVNRGDFEAKAEVQEMMATLLGDSRRMTYIESGHCSMIGNAAELARAVEEAWSVSKMKLEQES